MKIISFPTWELFAKDIRKQIRHDYFKELFETVAKMKILVIGETIVDEYMFVEPMGHSPKGNLISTRYLNEEMYAGGILACAKHVAAFSEHVCLVTCLGEFDSKVEFATQVLGDQIVFHPLFRCNAPTTVNRRYVHTMPDGTLQKLFGVYHFKHETLDKSLEAKVINTLHNLIPLYDAVLVVDYGHGFFTPAIREVITDKASFLALNVQTNSTNFGFNSVYKFSRADYVCIDKLEGQICEQDQFEAPEVLVQKIAKKMKAGAVGITLGRRGAMFFDVKSNTLFKVPALLTKSHDPVGTGDAYLSITTPFIASGVAPNITTFLGGIAGSLASEVVCNKEMVSRCQVEEVIKIFFNEQ